MTDVLDATSRPEANFRLNGGTILVENQPPHSVRLLKIIDPSIPAAAPRLSVEVPASAQLSTPIAMSAKVMPESTPVVSYHWDFGDGTAADGESVTHAYTRNGEFNVHFSAMGLDGIAQEKTFTVRVSGNFSTRLTPARNRRFVH